MSIQAGRRITAAELRPGDWLLFGPMYLRVESVAPLRGDSTRLCLVLTTERGKRVTLYYKRTEVLEVRRSGKEEER